MKTSVMDFIRVLQYRLQDYDLIKSWLHQRQFLQNFGDDIILQKSLQWIPILVATYSISKNRLAHTLLLEFISGDEHLASLICNKLF